ncbi:hypothetical protein D3C78_1084820 [compost metagenome]
MEIQLAWRAIAGNKQARTAGFQNAVVEIEDGHFPLFVTGNAFDIIDTYQRQLLHPVQYFRHEIGSLIQRHIAHGFTALRKLRTGRMQQVTAPTALA